MESNPQEWDRAAKEAGRFPSKPDGGFLSGKIGRSKVYFDCVLDGSSDEFVDKHTAYVPNPHHPVFAKQESFSRYRYRSALKGLHHLSLNS